jgi:pimeloyl-ACP methyl ester carboxylesterase
MATLVVLAALLIPCLLIGGGLALFWKRKRRAVLRWSGITYLILVAVVLFGVGPYLMAWAISHSGTRPQDRELDDKPANYGIGYEDVVFEARDSVRLSGWFVPPSKRDVILICTHGLFRSRVEILGRIVPLVREGYGALLYDSRSHGESDKSVVSLGFNEKNDVLGALEYIQNRYQDTAHKPAVVLMGVSMGAAATMAAAAESRGYAAIILDSPFLSLKDTVIRHSWLFFKMPRYPFPSIFLFWFQHMTGVDPERIDALQAIRQLEPVPLLVIASEGDQRMGTTGARALYAESRAPLKKLKLFGEDVPHGASARTHPEAYSDTLLSFLARALPQEGRSAGQ